MFKPDYSIQALADLRQDDIYSVAESLMAYGVPAFWRGTAFDLSALRRPRTIRSGDESFVTTGISRREEPEPEHIIVLRDALPTPWVQFIRDLHSSAATTSNSHTNIYRHKLRTNILDAPIDKAISQAGCLQTADVYVKLKEIALNAEAPFSGLSEEGALYYTNEKDQRDKLTKNALDKRLAKRRKQVGIPVSRL